MRNYKSTQKDSKIPQKCLPVVAVADLLESNIAAMLRTSQRPPTDPFCCWIASSKTRKFPKIDKN
jgi:hypothetical protein